MLERVEQISSKNHLRNKGSFWSDELLNTGYLNYYDNLTSKELDKEFDNDLLSLIKVLSKLPEKNRKILIDKLANVFELYLSNKIEKELEQSFQKILDF